MTRTLTLLAVSAAFAFLAAAPAGAVVYCRAVGVPKGCVWAPGGRVVVVPPPAVVVTPVPRAAAPVVVVPPAAVVVPGVGVPGVGAPGVGVHPGYGANLGGPVNRVGVR